MFDDFRRDANNDSNDSFNSGDFSDNFFFNDDAQKPTYFAEEKQDAPVAEETVDDVTRLESATVQPAPKKAASRKRKAARSGPVRGFLGMSPMQTLILSVMLFMMVCLLGFLFLLVAESIQIF